MAGRGSADETLPIDTDPENDSIDPDAGERPIHFHPGAWGVVWVGGATGTTARYLIGQAIPHLDGITAATIGINVAGAFVLGLLVAWLAGRGPDVGRRRMVRLGFGTGMLGGFTTYSALAVDTVTLLVAGRIGAAAGYALGTVVVGAAASYAGIRLGGRLADRGPL